MITPKMNAIIKTEQRKNYLFIKNSGILNTLKELNKNNANLAEEIIKNNAKNVVIDQKGVIYPDSIVFTINTVNEYINILPKEARSWRIAVVYTLKSGEIGRFWETVCVNRGYNFHTFFNLKEAINWINVE